MSSGNPDGRVLDFYFDGGIINGRSTPMMNNTKVPCDSPFPGILQDPASSVVFHKGSNSIGKRFHSEIQQPYQILQQQQLQQMALHNLRNVKPRVNYQQTSPISPLSPGDFSSNSSFSLDFSSIPSSPPMISRWRNNSPILANRNFTPPVNNFSSLGAIFLPNMVQNRKAVFPNDERLLILRDQSDRKMKSRLQELEKQLLDDDDENDNGTDDVSVVTNSDWSKTIQNLNLISRNPSLISPSPTSPSTSCSSTLASPLITCPKNSIVEAATAIADGKADVASEILTGLLQVSNVKDTSEQRLTAYMASALRFRLNPSENSGAVSVSELNGKKQVLSTQMLYEVSPCFKLGFMAANLAILESIFDLPSKKLHVIDFDICQGSRYVHLLHGLAANKSNNPAFLKISAINDQFVDVEENRLKLIGDGLKTLSEKIGVTLNFSVINLKATELNREKLGVEDDEALVVNFAFKLYKLPDESVTTENQRDELLRRVKGLSPTVVTVVEQEKNANTATFVTRVKEEWEYNGALFESLDAILLKESTDRVRIEEELGRKICNSVACEGRDRQERCEVFGKWRARMSMAGFNIRAMSSLVSDSLRSKLNSGTRGNPGFSIKEEFGGICFGWKGRTITVASAWR